MNASCIDCFVSPVSSFSATAVSAQMTSSISSIVMRDGCRGGRVRARADPVRQGLAPNSTRHLAVRDATSRKRRNFRTDNWPHPFVKRGLRLGANDPVMRWGCPADDELYASRRTNPIKENFSGEGANPFSIDRCRRRSIILKDNLGRPAGSCSRIRNC
jgi:hypothetical protein